MSDKVCNRCGKKGLGWDVPFHQKTGKWKLENHKTNEGVWCNKPTEVSMMRKKHEVTLCQLCSDSNFGLLEKNQDAIKKHMDMFHKDGRTMTTLDYSMMMGMRPYLLKFYRDDPSYHRYKHLDKA